MEVIRLHFGTVLHFQNGVTGLSWTIHFLSLMRSLAHYIIYNTDAAVLFIDNNGGCGGAMLQVIKPIVEPLSPSPVVVIHRSAECVNLGAVSCFNHSFPLIDQCIDTTIGVVKRNMEIASLDICFRSTTNNLESCTICGHLGYILVRRIHTAAEFKLFRHLHVAFPCPRHIAGKEEFNIHGHIVPSLLAEYLDRNLHLLGSAGSKSGNALYRTFLYNLAVLAYLIHHIMVERNEIVFVEHFNLAFAGINQFHTYILINLLYLKVLRFGAKVRQHDSIHTEHTVIGPVAVVATITKIFVSIGGISVNCLVYPVPNGSTAEVVGTFHCRPIVNQVSGSITHRVGIFRNMVRILHICLTRCNMLNPSYRGILVRTHIHNIVVAFVLYGTASVIVLNGLISRNEVVTGTGFVTQTPNHNGGTVHMRAYHFHITRNVRSTPFLGVRKRGITIIILVALNISLILKVQSVLVCQIVPIRIVAIVAVADMVDIALLHQEYFLLHLLTGNGMSTAGISLMTVYSLHLDRLVIHVEITSGQSEFIILSRRLTDFHCTNSEICTGTVNNTVFFVFQFGHQHIAIWHFRTPRLGVINRKFCMVKHLLSICNFIQGILCVFYCSKSGVCVKFNWENRILHLIPLRSFLAHIAHFCIHRERGLVSSQCACAYRQITDFQLRSAGQVCAANNTGQAEHIL